MSKQFFPIKRQVASKCQDPVVSISCTTYNQGRFIRQCVESFLMQETNFPVEILIHDDASTDSTPDILKAYRDEYPHIIRLLLQEENQFAKGVNVNSFNFQRARGQYIALCHGDDYWLDPEKLVKQVRLIKEFNVGMVGHPSEKVNVNGHSLKQVSGLEVKEVTQLYLENIKKYSGNVLPFGSIMIDEKTKNNLIKYMPPVRYHTGIQLLGCLRNGVVISPEVMSAYRVNVPGSTTEIMLEDRLRRIETIILRIESFKFLKSIYPKSEGSHFDDMISSQFASKYSLRYPRSGLKIMKAMMSGESFFKKVHLFMLSIKNIINKVVHG